MFLSQKAQYLRFSFKSASVERMLTQQVLLIKLIRRCERGRWCGYIIFSTTTASRLREGKKNVPGMLSSILSWIKEMYKYYTGQYLYCSPQLCIRTSHAVFSIKKNKNKKHRTRQIVSMNSLLHVHLIVFENCDMDSYSSFSYWVTCLILSKVLRQRLQTSWRRRTASAWKMI